MLLQKAKAAATCRDAQRTRLCVILYYFNEFCGSVHQLAFCSFGLRHDDTFKMKHEWRGSTSSQDGRDFPR
jgi:hypothetical protein